MPYIIKYKTPNGNTEHHGYYDTKPEAEREMARLKKRYPTWKLALQRVYSTQHHIVHSYWSGPAKYVAVVVIFLLILIMVSQFLIPALVLAGNIIDTDMFGWHTILKSDTPGNPVAMVVNENEVVGRETGGVIESLDTNEIWGIIEHYSEFYRHESVAPTTIQAANQWHVLNGYTVGLVGVHWTFTDGHQLALTAQADNGDGNTVITCNLHGMANGDVASIAGSVNYNGIWVVEQVTANTFVIVDPFVANEGALTGEMASYLTSVRPHCPGAYRVSYSLTMTPAQNNNAFEIVIFINDDYQVQTETQVRTGNAADFQVVASGGFFNFTVGDKVCIAVMNLTAVQNFTVRNANVAVNRVGQ